MAPLNRRGLPTPRFEPVHELDAGGLIAAIAGGTWVVDLRPRRNFAAEHRLGTVNLELGTNLTTYLGWIVPWDRELILLAEDPADIDQARRLIARIGRDDLSGSALWAKVVADSPAGGSAASSYGLRSYPVASFSDLARAWSQSPASRPQVIDVRHAHEWQAGHIVGARHLALPELVGHRSEVPPTGQIWVHCAAGFRAAVAASLLSGWGASPILIDDLWDNATESSLPIASGREPGERRAS
jgi:rhodanese-related sulfurtransferase